MGTRLWMAVESPAACLGSREACGSPWHRVPASQSAAPGALVERRRGRSCGSDKREGPGLKPRAFVACASDKRARREEGWRRLACVSSRSVGEAVRGRAIWSLRGLR